MNVVYASDDNFAEIMGVSICSLFENNKDVVELTVYVLDDNISIENKQKLDELAKTYGREIKKISISSVTKEIAHLQQDRGGASQFSRLFLSKLLPDNCPRALYLDCDTCIRTNIEKFYNQDFEGNTICGVMDCISKQHRSRLGLKEAEIYINSGMMLIDLKAWKENQIEDKILEVIKKFHGSVPYADQGILNLALQGKIKLAHPRYNCMSIFTAFSFDDLLKYRKPSACYSSADIEDAKKAPSIVHFVTLFCISRPWFKKSSGPFFDEWRRYKQLSPWHDAPARKIQKNLSQHLGVCFYNFVPKGISLPILGFLHARIKPMLMGGL